MTVIAKGGTVAAWLGSSMNAVACRDHRGQWRWCRWKYELLVHRLVSWLVGWGIDRIQSVWLNSANLTEFSQFYWIQAILLNSVACVQLDWTSNMSRQKIICQWTRRLTTIPRPPLESREFRSVGSIFVWFICHLFFKITFKMMPKQK